MKPSDRLLAITVLAALATASAPAFADTCKDVKFKVTNNHSEGREIEIRKVKYFNPHTGRTHTEDVGNLMCSHGGTCTTRGDNIANAKNVDLNSIRARMLSQGHAPKIETRNKPGVTALREIAAGEIGIEMLRKVPI
jgi:hypothetical protein